MCIQHIYSTFIVLSSRGAIHKQTSFQKRMQTYIIGELYDETDHCRLCLLRAQYLIAKCPNHRLDRDFSVVIIELA